MHIPANKSNKKVFIIIATALILLVASIGVTYYFKVGPFAPALNDSVDLNPASEEQKATGSDIKQNSLDQIDGGKSNTGSDPSPEPQAVEGSDKKSVGMEITAANQTDTTVQVRTLIQTVTNTGTCSLSMKNPQGTAHTASVGVQALSSTTTCKGFDIPLSQLSPGPWIIVVDFSNDNLTASTSKEITVK